MSPRPLLAALLLTIGLSACSFGMNATETEKRPATPSVPVPNAANVPRATSFAPVVEGEPNMLATAHIAVILYEGAGTVGYDVGCGDAVLLIDRPAEVGDSSLDQALRTLLATPASVEAEGTTYANTLGGTSLLLESATIENGVATIRFTGNLMFGGMCDSPRVEAQIEHTVLQFPEVESYVVELNGSSDSWDQLFSFKGI